MKRRGTQNRVLFFSHDSVGLGHLRRSMNLAGALVRGIPGTSCLIATGSACATHFPVDDGVDVVKLPSACKDTSGRYCPRTLGGETGALVRLRRHILLGVLAGFDPHLLVVDHSVLGIGDELDEILECCRRRGTRTLLGLRDIIDSPDVVASEWSRPRVRRALAAEYDRVCVYGSEEVFDVRAEYPIPPELGDRVQYVGYVVRQHRPEPQVLPRIKPQVLVTVGGGEDGAERIEAYLDALALGPAEWESNIVLGPLLDPERARSIKRRARLFNGVTVHRFHADLPRLLDRSDAVVSMAGYNTSAEILVARKPAVFLPRSFPRKEQLIRAQRFAQLGLADVLESPQSQGLRDAVRGALDKGRIEGTLPPLDGHRRLCEHARELLETGLTKTKARANA